MDAAGVRSALLVGVSDSARRGLAFTVRYPQRVTGVVASGGSFGEFPDPSPEEAEARKVMRELFADRCSRHGNTLNASSAPPSPDPRVRGRQYETAARKPTQPAGDWATRRYLHPPAVV